MTIHIVLTEAELPSRNIIFIFAFEIKLPLILLGVVLDLTCLDTEG